MVDLLSKIIDNKKVEVRRRKKEIPASTLFGVIETLNAPKGFSAVLKGHPQVALIAEIKKSSPSAGLLRRDFDPAAIAKCYESNGAKAVSVLTDEHFFHGQLEHLAQVREEINLPLLRKDFMIEPYQVIEARASGADAILLISCVLSESQCLELAAAARELKLDLLVEVHTPEALARALSNGFRLIGINNRNLQTFQVDLATTERLMLLIPKDVTVVSESGIKDRNDVERLGEMGVDAVLVGERLMRQADVGVAVREVVGVRKWLR